KEHVHARYPRKLVNGAPGAAVDDTRPRLGDEIPGLGIDVDRRETAMPVPEQGGGDDAGAEAEVGARLDDLIRLRGTDNRAPPEPPRPVRLRRADSPARVGRQPPRQLVKELAVVFQLLHPRPYLPDPGPGDRGHEPAELVPVERVQVVGVVRGLAAMHKPTE